MISLTAVVFAGWRVGRYKSADRVVLHARSLIPPFYLLKEAIDTVRWFNAGR